MFFPFQVSKVLKKKASESRLMVENRNLSRQNSLNSTTSSCISMDEGTVAKEADIVKVQSTPFPIRNP